MVLSPLAKFANSPEIYRQLEKLCDCHNRASKGETEITLTFDEQELDREIKSAIDRTMNRHFGKQKTRPWN